MTSLAILAQVGNGEAEPSFVPLLVFLVIVVASIAGMWTTFAKAGKPGWAAIIPIYNVIVLLEIAGKPIWWLLLFFIPFVNAIISILLSIDVAKSFGKGIGFGLGLAFLPPIFYAILGFGDAKYLGPSQS